MHPSQEPLRFYNNYQEVYQRPEGYFNSLAKEIVRPLRDKEHPRILDIGCGFGDLLAAVYGESGAKTDCFGLTIAEHEAKFIKKERSFIKVVLGKEQHLTNLFETSSFDLIINFHTLSYVRQKEQRTVVKGMIDLLRPKGILYLGLIDNWVKLSDGISQHGEGFVQFYYSPKIFLTLGRHCKLISSTVKKDDNYRLQVWQKRHKPTTPWQGILLYLGYVIRNNFLFLGHFQKLVRKLSR